MPAKEFISRNWNRIVSKNGKKEKKWNKPNILLLTEAHFAGV